MKREKGDEKNKRKKVKEEQLRGKKKSTKKEIKDTKKEARPGERQKAALMMSGSRGRVKFGIFFLPPPLLSFPVRLALKSVA